MGRRVASRLLWALPPAACVVAALFAWQVAGSLAGPGGAAHREAEVSDDMDGLDAARRRVEDAAESARASSAKTFLDDLGASFDSGGAADAEALPADDSAAGSGSSEVDRSEEDADVNSPDGAPEGKAGEEEGSTGSGISGAADDAAGGEASADVSVAWSDDEGLVSQATGILEAYRELFARYDGIVFRDRYSAGLFPGLANVAYAPDVLFGYPATVREKRRSAVVCPISLEGREGTFGISEYAAAYRSFSLAAIRALLARGYGVTLASFNESQGDELEIEALVGGLTEREREGVTCARYHTRPEEVVRELEDAECVVATRFHAMVLGIAHGCRVLPVIYNQKTEKVLEDLAYPLSVRLDELAGADADALVARLLATEPVDVAPLAAGSEGQFQFLDRLLR